MFQTVDTSLCIYFSKKPPIQYIFHQFVIEMPPKGRKHTFIKVGVHEFLQFDLTEKISS